MLDILLDFALALQVGVFRIRRIPQGPKDSLPLLASLISTAKSQPPSHDYLTLMKVRVEMTYWSDREASINLPGPPSRFCSLCKSCQMRDIARWKAMQEIQMEYFLIALSCKI